MRNHPKYEKTLVIIKSDTKRN